MNLDETRRKLCTTEMSLADTKRKLEASEKRNEKLQTENEDLKERMRKASSHLHLPTSWKEYNAPGACGFCGSLTCNRNCVK